MNITHNYQISRIISTIRLAKLNYEKLIPQYAILHIFIISHLLTIYKTYSCQNVVPREKINLSLNIGIN